MCQCEKTGQISLWLLVWCKRGLRWPRELDRQMGTVQRHTHPLWLDDWLLNKTSPALMGLPSAVEIRWIIGCWGCEWFLPPFVCPVVFITAIQLGRGPRQQPFTHRTVSWSPALLHPSPIRLQSHRAAPLGFKSSLDVSVCLCNYCKLWP